MVSVKGQRNGDNGDKYKRSGLVDWKTVATNITVIVIIAVLTLAVTQVTGGSNLEPRVIKLEQNIISNEKLQAERYNTLLRDIRDVKGRLPK